VIIGNSEETCKNATYKLGIISRDYSMRISTNGTEVLAFKGKPRIRIRITVTKRILEHVINFNYSGFNVSSDK
jgi:hypothetical protein